MPASLTTINALLKEMYQGSLRDALQSEVIGLKRIEQTSRGVTSEVSGRYVTFPVRVRRNHGQGYRQENEQLPTAGQQGYVAPRIPLKFGYGRTRFTGQLMRLADSNAEAFANAMEREMQGLKEDVRKDSGRIFYGNAAGTLATVTADGVNTITVDNVQYLELDMMIDVQTTAGVTHAVNRKITAINPSTKVVTYDGADASAAIVATDIVTRTGSGPVSATVFREPNGLKNIVAATGALFSVDPATEPTWAAFVDTNGGTPRALTELLWINACDKIRIQGGKTSVIFTSLGVRRSYFNILKADRRIVAPQKFEGGFTGLSFAAGNEDIPVVADVDCPPGTSWGLEESAFTVYREADWHFADDDGSVLKWIHDFDAWEAVLRKYWEIGIDVRNHNFQVNDLIES